MANRICVTSLTTGLNSKISSIKPNKNITPPPTVMNKRIVLIPSIKITAKRKEEKRAIPPNFGIEV